MRRSASCTASAKLVEIGFDARRRPPRRSASRSGPRSRPCRQGAGAPWWLGNSSSSWLDLFERAAAGAAALESELQQHVDRLLGLGGGDIVGQRLQSRDGIDQHIDLERGVRVRSARRCRAPGTGRSPGWRSAGCGSRTPPPLPPAARSRRSGPSSRCAACCAHRCGVMVVLAWGASCSPNLSSRCRIQRALCSSADLRSTATGAGRSPASRFQLWRRCRPAPAAHGRAESPWSADRTTCRSSSSSAAAMASASKPEPMEPCRKSLVSDMRAFPFHPVIAGLDPAIQT